MTKNYIVLIFLFFTHSIFSVDKDLLIIDSYRMIEQSGFSFDFNLKENSGNKDSEYTMKVYVKDNSSDYAICKYIEPVKMKGRVILVDGKNFWYLDRGMKSPIRISSRQMLLGQASAGDITRIIFSNYYTINSQTEEGEHISLKLNAIPNKEAVYNSINLIVQQGTYRPILAECYAKSGKLLKTIEYVNFDKYKGREVLTGMLITDANGKSTSRVTLSNFSSEILEPMYFNKTQMTRIPQ